MEYYLAKGANPMHPCEDGIFPLQLLQESTRFNDRDKTKLLALMMKSISERPVPATTDKAPDQSAALAPQEVALERDVEIQKPLVLRPHKPPPLRLKL